MRILSSRVGSGTSGTLPPHHDLLAVHCAGKRYIGGAGAIEVGGAKWSGSNVGVEVALLATKGERRLWVNC